MDRGFSTGGMQYGYDKIPVFDPSGAKDADGRPIVIGRRIHINDEEAAVIRRIFEWAADGVGLATIVDRLNREGVPGTGGKRWNKTPVDRILKNERYLGLQIYGQRAVERDPSTGKKIMRPRPRSDWKVIRRPEMRIVSDELWERTQATRKAVREAVAPKDNLAAARAASTTRSTCSQGLENVASAAAPSPASAAGRGVRDLGAHGPGRTARAPARTG
jgi:site-specific DNA recombinase